MSVLIPNLLVGTFMVIVWWPDFMADENPYSRGAGILFVWLLGPILFLAVAVLYLLAVLLSWGLDCLAWVVVWMAGGDGE